MEEVSCPEGLAAHEAIKSHFSKLVIAIMRGSIPDDLYSADVLGADTIDTLLNQNLTERQKGRQFVRELQNAVLLKPKCFTTICDALTEEKLSKDLSRDLKSESNCCVGPQAPPSFEIETWGVALPPGFLPLRA